MKGDRSAPLAHETGMMRQAERKVGVFRCVRNRPAPNSVCSGGDSISRDGLKRAEMG
jgi:hypothetical protein